MENRGYRVILTTIDSEFKARALARRLVEDRVAACVNVVGPATSIYRWNDEIHEESEWMLWIKSREDRLDALRRELAELHDYKVPERIELVIEDGETRYLRWIDGCLDGPGSPD